MDKRKGQLKHVLTRNVAERGEDLPGVVSPDDVDWYQSAYTDYTHDE